MSNDLKKWRARSDSLGRNRLVMGKTPEEAARKFAIRFVEDGFVGTDELNTIEDIEVVEMSFQNNAEVETGQTHTFKVVLAELELELEEVVAKAEGSGK